MPRQVPLTDTQRFEQSQWGAQDQIVITAVPAAASAGLVGQALVNAGALTVSGTYECLIPICGFRQAFEVILTATFASGTVSSALNTLYYVTNASTPSTWVNKTAGTGAGSLTSTTRQTASVAAANLKGEQFARLTLTLTGIASVTFTQGEYNGL